MAKTKKNTIFIFTVIISAGLLYGYWHWLPQRATVKNRPMSADMTNCQKAIPNKHIMSSGVGSGAIAPCCLEQNNNSQSGALTLNNPCPKEIIRQNVSAGSIDADNFSGQLVLQANSAPPPQTKLLTSVIKIE